MLVTSDYLLFVTPVICYTQNKILENIINNNINYFIKFISPILTFIEA